MEALDVDGLFWLASNPEDKEAGRLTFSDESGAELDLIGSFSGITDFGKIFGDPVRIHGIAGNKLLTLDGCHQSSQSISMPGFVRERYYVPSTFVGAHFSHGESLEFVNVHLQVDHLRAWVGKSGTHVEITSGEDSKGISKVVITHEALEKVTGSSHIGELEISFPFRFHPDDSGKTWIMQNCEFGTRFSNRLSLEDVKQVCAAIQDLVTIGVDTPTTVNGLTLETADNERVELYARIRGSLLQVKTKDVHPSEMMFTFDHIGGLSGIAGWLDVSKRYGAVIGSLLSHWYLPRLYEENRFLNVVIAAEAVERIRTQEQGLNFQRALERLAKDAGSTFEALVDDAESWSKEIVRVRINQIVHRGLGGEVEGSRLYDLTESLYYLVVLCLLRECGVPENAFSNIKQHQRFKQLGHRLSGLQ